MLSLLLPAAFSFILSLTTRLVLLTILRLCTCQQALPAQLLCLCPAVPPSALTVLTILLHQHLLEDMVSILQSLLGQVALPLHLDVEGLGYVGHDDVDQLADAKDNVLKDDDKGKLEGEDLPVDRRERARVVSKTAIIAFRLASGDPVLDRRL